MVLALTLTLVLALVRNITISPTALALGVLISSIPGLDMCTCGGRVVARIACKNNVFATFFHETTLSVGGRGDGPKKALT